MTTVNLNAEEVMTAALEALTPVGELGLTVERTASMIPQSPWDRIEVYGTADGPEGPHVVVTAAAELEDAHGYDVGAYCHYEEDAVGSIERCDLAHLRETVLQAGARL